MRSLSFYLVLFVLKLKGIKAAFSKDPINYKKLRNDDVHSSGIKNSKQFRIKDSQITETGESYPEQKLIIFIHGGAFVYGPARHHWDAVKKLSARTKIKIWMVDYPKAPEVKITEISANIDQVYSFALEKFDHKKIIMIGDSVGGTLILALTQRIIKTTTPLPSLLVLISPVMDAAFKNIAIPAIEKSDPMLSRAGALSAKKLCAENGDLDHPSISPVNGDFKGFPKTILFMATNDITFPDQKTLVKKLSVAGIDHRVIVGEGMPHIWPILPVMKEARIAFNQILEEIQSQ